MTILSPAGSIAISPANTPVNEITGWANFGDTQYTSGSPWQPTADQWTNVPNNGLDVITSQTPLDVTAFYDTVTSKITGRNLDGLLITVEFIGTPTTATATFLDTAFFIGGGLGPLGDGRIYQRTLSFPKGQGVPRVHSFTVAGYTLGTWETNGAIFQMNPTAALDIYKVRYVLTRTHKAR